MLPIKVKVARLLINIFIKNQKIIKNLKRSILFSINCYHIFNLQISRYKQVKEFPFYVEIRSITIIPQFATIKLKSIASRK